MNSTLLLDIEKSFASMLPPGWVGKYAAFLGNASGVVKANKHNDVYVIKHDRSVEVVRNTRAPNQAKLAVIVGYDAQNPTLLQVLREVNAYQKPPYSPVTEHADPNHGRWGRDPLFIEKLQILDLLPHPASFTGMVVQLRGGKYYLNGDHILPNQTVDFSAEIPASGACWVLAEVDDAKVITLRAGATVASREVLTPEDIPAPATGQKRLFAVRCYYGQTRIVQTKTMQDIYILHDVPGEGGTGGGGFDIPIVTSDPATPADGEMWLLRETVGAIPNGTPIGMLLALTYTGNTGTTSELQLSAWDDTTNTIIRYASL